MISVTFLLWWVLIGFFYVVRLSEVSRNYENTGFWDTFLAKSHIKCPEIVKITPFGTLFLR